MLVLYSQLVWCQRPLKLFEEEVPALVNLQACEQCEACMMLDAMSSTMTVRVVASLIMEV